MLEHVSPEFIRPKRVVVLGGSGFVGKTLSKSLKSEGIETLSLSSSQLDLATEGAAEQLSSLLTSNDCLVILSALTPDKGRDNATFMRNLKMVEHICTAVANTKPAHVIYFSSDAVYPLTTTRINEQSLAAPTDLYGTMHLARELMLQNAIGDTPLCILRPTLIYGSEDTHNSYGPNRFRRQAASDGQIVIGGEGEETRDHISVEDVVKILQLVMAHKSKGTLNLATGQSTSFADVARLVASQFEHAVPVQTTERKSPITHRSFDITACLKAFPGIQFKALEEGIREAHVESQRDNG